MTFKEFIYQEWDGWKYWGQKSAKVDTPLGIVSPYPRGISGALPMQAIGGSSDMPLWSGGYAYSKSQLSPDFAIKVPEDSVTGRIVNLTNGNHEWIADGKDGENHTKSIIITLQIGEKTRSFSVPFARIKKMTNKPQKGKMATIVLQSRPESPNLGTPQIQQIQVF